MGAGHARLRSQVGGARRLVMVAAAARDADQDYKQCQVPIANLPDLTALGRHHTRGSRRGICHKDRAVRSISISATRRSAAAA
jgi:hypothetical protein